MRILILTSFLPYPSAGHAGGVVLWRMIQGLAARHELSLISFANDEEEQHQGEALSDYCVPVQTVLRSNTSAIGDFSLRAGQRIRSLLLSRLPYDVWRFRSQAMFDAITRALKETPFDIVQVEFTQMGQYVDALRDHPRTIFREYDSTFVLYRRRVQATHTLWRKLYHYAQWRRMRRYELAVCRRFHKVVVPSPQAKAELLAQSPGLDVSIVPFGITLPSVPEFIKSPDNKRILFVGAMGRPLNVESVVYFYQQIWPLIRTEEPKAEFWVVGSSPPPHISRLAQLDSSVRVTGFVDDLIPFYAQASVFAAPLVVGGGVVTKILDAMAMSRAVVTTSIGNEGIRATPGHDLLVADEPNEFARRVVELLRDPARRWQFGQNGRRFVEERFSWRSVIDRLECIYDEMMSENSEADGV
jgi:glycosyltransferase involved in cell wall biosynthesis